MEPRLKYCESIPIAYIPGSGRISDPAETRVYSRPSVDRIVGMYEDMYVNLFTRSYLLILRVLGCFRYTSPVSYPSSYARTKSHGLLSCQSVKETFGKSLRD